MPDERQDSIRQGIAAPPESPIGAAAEEERRERAAHGPAIGGAMGGTSDANTPGDEAQEAAARYVAEEGEESGPGGEEDEADPTEMYRDIPGDRVGG